MKAHLSLSNNNLAEYDWTSSMIFLGPAAALEKDDFFRHITSIVNQVAAWNSDEEFLSLVALLHECVHYGQDIFTGVGMWDVYHTYNMLEPLQWAMSFAQNGASPAVVGAQVAAIEKVLLLSRYNQAASDPVHTVLPPIANADARMKLRDTDSFTLRSLLEAEAVASTLLQLIDVAQTEPQAVISNRQASVYQPNEMPREYNRFWDDMLDFVPHVFGTSDRLSPRQKVNILLKITLTLLDLAFAVPSPSLLERRGQKLDDYLPGVRMFRMMSALAGMSNDALLGLGVPLGAGNVGEVARLLQPSLDYDYALPHEIYTDWATILSELSSRTDDHALKFRVRACKVRLSHADWMIGKRVSTLVSTRLPIFTVRDNSGIFEVAMNEDLMDFEMRKYRFFDLLRLNGQLRLVSLVVFKEKYKCPFALSGICSDEVPRCRSGISLPKDIPTTEGCFIRNFVKSPTAH